MITAFGASPQNLTVGGSTTIFVLTRGGALPLSYTYSGLPPGCAGANGSFLNCTPAVAGTFLLEVTVRGTDNLSAVGFTNLSVLPPPGAPLSLVGFLVYPPSIEPGNYTVFLALATGGRAPVAYGYAGLPPGCLPLPLPIVPCRPSAPGTYLVTLTVSDAVGARVFSAVTLVVAASAGPVPTATSGPTPLQVTEYLGIGIAAGAAGMACGSFLWRRRRQVGPRP